MLTDTLTLAKQVLDHCPPDMHCREPYWSATDDELEAFRALCAEEAVAAERERLSKIAGEPVAWRNFDGEGGYDFREYDMNEDYKREWERRNPNHKEWVDALHTADQIAYAIVRAEDAVKLAAYKKLSWLFGHCKAIGMEKQSDSKELEHDICLFTIDLKQRITDLESANTAFAQRQEWWNKRMAELEQQLAAMTTDRDEWKESAFRAHKNVRRDAESQFARESGKEEV